MVSGELSLYMAMTPSLLSVAVETAFGAVLLAVFDSAPQRSILVTMQIVFLVIRDTVMNLN